MGEWVLGIGYRVLGIGYWVLNIKFFPAPSTHLTHLTHLHPSTLPLPHPSTLSPPTYGTLSKYLSTPFPYGPCFDQSQRSDGVTVQ
jgi:hypothetical protein